MTTALQLNLLVTRPAPRAQEFSRFTMINNGVVVASCVVEPFYISKARLEQLAKKHKPPQWWYDLPDEDLF